MLEAQFTGGSEKVDFPHRSKLGEGDVLGGASEKLRHGSSLVAVSRCVAWALSMKSWVVRCSYKSGNVLHQVGTVSFFRTGSFDIFIGLPG